MEEIHKLRAQISNIVRANFPDSEADAGFTHKLPPPQDIQVRGNKFFCHEYDGLTFDPHVRHLYVLTA
jgi:ATP-dependent RNA helicase DHX37/DHR1